jgi:hypothetical protein
MKREFNHDLPVVTDDALTVVRVDSSAPGVAVRRE